MNACACMGAMGKDPYCPCEMKRLGLVVSIQEVHISQEVWEFMDAQDKDTINNLKTAAAFKYMFRNKK